MEDQKRPQKIKVLEEIRNRWKFLKDKKGFKRSEKKKFQKR